MTLPGNLGTMKRVCGSCRKKTCSDWGGCRVVFTRGMLSTFYYQCDQKAVSGVLASQVVVRGTLLKPAHSEGTNHMLEGDWLSASEAYGFICSWMMVIGRLVLFLLCPACFGSVPGRNNTAGVVAAHFTSACKMGGREGGAFVQSHLPPCKESLPLQWESNRLHLFCLSLKHSFLVLTGNNLAGISN